MILCGGKGTRLGEVTGNLIPKPMARIGEHPILWHIMNSYAAAGYRRFIICAGHLGWHIKEYFLSYQYRTADLTIRTGPDPSVVAHPREQIQDWEITIVETGEETNTAGRVRRASRFLDGDRFMLTYGDGVSNVDLRALEQFHRAHGKAATMTCVVPPGRFGELSLDGDQVVAMAEKPLISDRFINGGFMVLERRFIDAFIGPDSDRIMLEREPMAKASADGELMAFRHADFWQCMDTARDWELLNQLWLSGKAPWRT
jgi:glucose-1-phosphate cytidylyltransferase